MHFLSSFRLNEKKSILCMLVHVEVVNQHVTCGASNKLSYRYACLILNPGDKFRKTYVGSRRIDGPSDSNFYEEYKLSRSPL